MIGGANREPGERRELVVMKFGGSSLQDADRLRAAVDRVVAARDQQPCVVLSAMGRTTDTLLCAARAAEAGGDDAGTEALAIADGVFADAAKVADEALTGVAAMDEAAAVANVLAELRAEVLVLLRGTHLLRELSSRTRDAIVAHGERAATALFSAMLRQRGIETVEVDARTVIRTDDRFGNARPDPTAIRDLARARIAPVLERGAVVVTQGFIGATAQGFTTTLGRGGSDWSAALLGAALGATEVQIWTDVEGVLSADPRTVPNARPVPVLSPPEAAELAAFGARVLHPATIQPAIDAAIPVTVRHTMRPDGAFTTIDPRRTHTARGVAALAHRGPVTVLTMTSRRMLAAAGYLARLFQAFGDLDICVDLVVTAEVSVACTVEPDAPLDRLVAALDGLAHVEIARDRAIVAAVGEGLRRSPGTIERAAKALRPIVPELVSMGGNDRNLSVVVAMHEVDDAMRRLHDAFFPRSRRAPGGGTTTINKTEESPA